MKFILINLFIFSTFAAPSTLQDKINSFQSKSKLPANIKQEFSRATKELEDSGIEEKAKNIGVQVPAFKVGGKHVSEFYKNRPLIIKFYRGHWCPYCILELKEYESKLSEIKKYGNIIGLVPDLKKEIKKTKRTHQLSFPIYRDENHKIGRSFGLAFKVDKKILVMYKGFNIDLKKSQGGSGDELPMPGTYVIDTNGKIVYAFVDADYTKRAPLEEVMNALKKAK